MIGVSFGCLAIRAVVELPGSRVHAHTLPYTTFLCSTKQVGSGVFAFCKTPKSAWLWFTAVDNNAQDSGLGYLSSI